MRIKNYTPFPMLCYEGRGVNDAPFDTVVVRVTLDLGKHRVLRLAEEQTPLAFQDEYLGEPAQSSVRSESDLAPAKPCSDIIVIGSARAPGGDPIPSWPVRVKVGDLEKHLRVTGPRAWVRGKGGFALTDPEPCAEVPLRYELAFGGVARDGDQELTFAPNPLGVGFAPASSLEGKDRIEAPRIEDPADPVIALGKAYHPEGLGVWGRTWPPRVQHAGTYDEAWKRSGGRSCPWISISPTGTARIPTSSPPACSAGTRRSSSRQTSEALMVCNYPDVCLSPTTPVPYMIVSNFINSKELATPPT